MMSAKRGMGPSGWAPRRTHAVGTTSSSTRDPKRALISSALTGPSLDAGRPGKLEASTSESRRMQGGALNVTRKKEKEKSRNIEQRSDHETSSSYVSRFCLPDRAKE